MIKRRSCIPAAMILGLVMVTSCGSPDKVQGRKNVDRSSSTVQPAAATAPANDPGDFPPIPDISYDFIDRRPSWNLYDGVQLVPGRGLMMRVGDQLEVVRAAAPKRVGADRAVMVQADVLLPQGPGSGAGLWCRSDRSFDSGYAFVVGRAGGWGLFRYTNGVPEQLERGGIDPQELEGRDPISLWLVCGAPDDSGTVLAMSYNDKPFITVRDSATGPAGARVGASASRVPLTDKSATAWLQAYTIRLGS
jgi:hypothetical protein